MRRGTGLVFGLVLTSSASWAASPFKVTDLGSVFLGPIDKRPNVGGVSLVTSQGVLGTGQGYRESSVTLAAAQVVYINGQPKAPVYNRPGLLGGINNHGVLLANGAPFLRGYAYHAGASLHYPDGRREEIPGIPGHNYVAGRGINDAGVIVGHFTTFKNDVGDLDYGTPFYRRGSQAWTPFAYGTMVAVNNKGMALMYGWNTDEDGGAGIWSPETGLIPMMGWDYSYYSRPDFNDNNEILYTAVSGNPSSLMLRIQSPTGYRDISYPSIGGIPFQSGDIGGMNNLGNITLSQYYRDADNVFRNHWNLWRNGSWVDMSTAIRSQLPAGTFLERVGDIDDYGRVYGAATLADGTRTIIQVETVPEPATLLALGAGIAAITTRRRRSHQQDLSTKGKNP